MTSLTASQTIPGEYYLGGFPGTLQYKIDPGNIVHAVKHSVMKNLISIADTPM
jgi:hypothetical protein